MLKRYKLNPIIKPSMLKPSLKGFNVLGVFNPGATIFSKQVILLLRVAENCLKKKGFYTIPYYDFIDGNGVPRILEIPKTDPNVSPKDSRGIFYNGKDYLSSISHIRIARSHDGINFTIDKKPFIYPCLESESFGVEDARISKIDNTYYINYTAVSGDGYVTMLAETKDFITIERKGIIFPPLNKDVVIFEEKVKGKYIALHRPDNIGFGLPSIWYSESPDLIHWGNHKCLLRPDGSRFESQKIGGGSPPIKTKDGWLIIYHGKGDNSIYTLRLLLLDLENPSKIIKIGKCPVLQPAEIYEKKGFFNNVVFTNGLVVMPDNRVFIYYGVCDESVCLAITTINDLLILINTE